MNMKKINLKIGNTHHRIFFRFLWTYLLVAVSVLVILGFSSVHSLLRVRDDILDLQDSLLEEIRDELDLELTSIEKVSELLTADSGIIAAGYCTGESVQDHFTFASLQDSLHNAQELLRGDGSFYIYYQNSSSIVSSGYRYSIDNIDSFSSYHMGFTPEDFYAFINTSAGYSILHPNTSGALILYTVPIFDRNSAQYRNLGRLLVRIALPSLVERITGLDWMQDSLFYINYLNDTVCIRMDDDGRYTFTNMDTSGIPAMASGDIRIRQTRYHLAVINSAHSGWQYRIAIPYAALLQNTRAYQLMFAAGLLLSLALSGILSLYWARKFYKPTGRLLDSLNIQPGSSYDEALSYVESSVRSYRDRLMTNEKELAAFHIQKTDDFISSLCHGHLTDREMEIGIREYAAPLSGFSAFRIILFRLGHLRQSIFNTEGEIDYQLMRFVMQNVIQEVLGGSDASASNVIFASLEPQKLIAVIQDEPEDSLRQKLTFLGGFLREKIKTDGTICVSSRGIRLSDIPEHYQQLSELLDYKQFWGTAQDDLLFYEDFSEENTLPGDLSVRIKIFNAISVKQYSEARQILEDYLNQSFTKNVTSFQKEQIKLYGLISDISEQLQASDLIDDTILTALKDMGSLKTFSELKTSALLLFDRMTQLQADSGKSETPWWVPKAKAWIEEHYSDPQLCISSLAEKWNLTPSHFSKSYKKYTNTGILDYINLIRITHAKELLEKGFSVHDTALSVGYTETRALIRYFKRYEGVTPGQYQDTSRKDIS